MGTVSVHPSLSGGPADRAILAGLTPEPAFSVAEFEQRLRKVRDKMEERGIEVLLVFHPSNVLYLSGYQSIAMSNGECVVLPLSGDPELVVHGMEIGGALLHSWFKAPRAYDPDFSRAEYLARVLADRGLDGSRVGVELHTPAVPAELHESLRQALGKTDLVDGSRLVEEVKMTKSTREIDYLTPNPPKDTDGRREESGRGVRELQGK